MPRPKKDDGPKNPADMFEQMSKRLKTQTYQPNIYGYSPHPKQLEFHKSTEYITLFLGGNRSGKTHGGVSEDVIRLIKDTRFRSFDYEEPTRGRVVCVSYDQGVDQIILPYFKQFIPPSKLINGAWEDSYSRGNHLLTLADGAQCEFMTYDQDVEKFAGTSRHFIHFDEEPPREVFNECLARLVDTNGQAYITMTPVEGATWMFDEVYEPAFVAMDKEILIPANIELGISPAFSSQEVNTRVIEVGMNENPHLTAEAQEKFLRTLSDDDRAARSKGTFVSAGGRVFPNFNYTTHVINGDFDPRAKQREGWQIYTSTDHGWNNPTAWLWHGVSPSGKVITFDEIYLSKTTIDEFAKMVHEKERGYGIDTSKIIRTGDPAMHQHSGITGTTVVQEYGMRGLHIYTDSVPRDRWVGISRMQMYFKADKDTGIPPWQITGKCPNLAKELKALQFAKHASKKVAYDNNKKEEVQKKNDHAFDSAKYFATFLPDLTPTIDETELLRNPVGTVDYTSFMSAKVEQESGWIIH